MAVLVPDVKLDRFCPKQIISSVYQNNLAYHPGPVLPPGGDGSPVLVILALLLACLIRDPEVTGLNPSVENNMLERGINLNLTFF